MNKKRFVITFGLGLTLVLIIIWMLSFDFNLAQANPDVTATPIPKNGSDEITKSRQNVPFQEQITDGQSQNQSEITPFSSNSAHIANGDFENGQDGSWQEYSTHGWDIIVDTSTLPLTPHSGNWAAWLGGDFDDVSYISQGVTMPPGASTLSYWYWIASEDICGYDDGWVKINNSTVKNIDLCEDNNTIGWVEETIDISAYAGQVVSLQIRVETDDFLNSNFFVDDVMIDSGFYTYIPLNLNNFWAGYFDDFSDPNSGWPTDDDEYRSIGYLNGEYQIYLKNEYSVYWLTPGPLTGRDLFLPDDYRVETDMRMVSSSEGLYGLMFGIQFAPNSIEAYTVLINPTSREFILGKNMMDGSWIVLVDWTYSPALNQGTGSNHIAVDRIGSNIKLFINGSQVVNIDDSSFLGPGRDAGLLVRSIDEPPVDVRFDNFSASQP